MCTRRNEMARANGRCVWICMRVRVRTTCCCVGICAAYVHPAKRDGESQRSLCVDMHACAYSLLLRRDMCCVCAPGETRWREPTVVVCGYACVCVCVLPVAA